MKGWHILIILAVAGAGFAAYWFLYRKKHVGETPAQQSAPTHSPASYTVPSMPSATGAPIAKPVSAEKFLSAASGVMTAQANQVARQLTAQATKKINAGISQATSSLQKLVTGWMA